MSAWDVTGLGVLVGQAAGCSLLERKLSRLTGDASRISLHPLSCANQRGPSAIASDSLDVGLYYHRRFLGNLR